MKNNTLTNGVECLCGSVKIKISGNLRSVINCHCIQCMKTHGNFASYTATKEKNIEFIKKGTLRWYQSSLKAKRGFCNKCGASFFYKRINSEYISISAGMFRNPTRLITKKNIFIKGKLDYYTINNQLPKYHRYPKI